MCDCMSQKLKQDKSSKELSERREIKLFSKKFEQLELLDFKERENKKLLFLKV